MWTASSQQFIAQCVVLVAYRRLLHFYITICSEMIMRLIWKAGEFCILIIYIKNDSLILCVLTVSNIEYCSVLNQSARTESYQHRKPEPQLKTTMSFKETHFKCAYHCTQQWQHQTYNTHKTILISTPTLSVLHVRHNHLCIGSDFGHMLHTAQHITRDMKQWNTTDAATNRVICARAYT